jgi:hypothetical protein
MYDATLGWFAVVALDVASLWRREWFSPQHLLDICECSLEYATSSRAHTLENIRNTEENVPVSFVVSEV